MICIDSQRGNKRTFSTTHTHLKQTTAFNHHVDEPSVPSGKTLYLLTSKLNSSDDNSDTFQGYIVHTVDNINSMGHKYEAIVRIPDRNLPKYDLE